MSLPSELRAAILTTLEADYAVEAAFGGKAVKIFAKRPPINAIKPYGFIAGMTTRPDLADCMASAETDVQIDVWSITDPPGFGEVEAIAPAIEAALAPQDADGSVIPPFDLPTHRVVSVTPQGVDYLDDPSDGKTAHAVVRLTFATDPL